VGVLRVRCGRCDGRSMGGVLGAYAQGGISERQATTRCTTRTGGWDRANNFFITRIDPNLRLIT